MSMRARWPSSLAYLVLQQHDAVGSVAFDERVRSTVPPRSQQNHLLAIINSLNVAEPRDKTGTFAVFREVAETFPRRGLMVLVSDLLADSDGTMRGLRLLRQRGHDVLVFHVLDDDELEFPFAGPTRFDGLESLDHLNCNPRALRKGISKPYSDSSSKLAAVARETGSIMCCFVQVNRSTPRSAHS